VPTFTHIALRFAQALVDADFDAACALLAPELGRELSPDVLRSRLLDMYSGYAPADGPRSAALDEEFVLTDWPGKRPGDLGFAYVSILGKEFVEGVSVTVASINGRTLIRDIEWGRP
jgi:hypothetical protein